MTSTDPIIWWVRRDLRLSDNAALLAAVSRGVPVIPVFIYDPSIDALGAAPRWRLSLGLEHLAQRLVALGSRLICRKGAALAMLEELIVQTGARSVFWNRLYDPDSVERDTNVKAGLREKGIEARSFGGHLLFEPMSVESKTGGMYRVYTPFWNAVKTREVEAPRAAPSRIAAPDSWPATDDLAHWNLGAGMKRGAQVVRGYVRLGEAAAQERLVQFIEEDIAVYKLYRDQPAVLRTSLLSENLSLGEISPHQCWHAGRRAMEMGAAGAETFLKELVWREFSYHLMVHTPHILTANWKEAWDAFPWQTDEDHPHVTAWKQGRTGIRFVDSAMREMYVTGRMHNRGRMIVASYLTKHLMTDWRIGMRWFDDCLIDWDPAANAMGWQWAAGSGPDAAPYFRVFNPVSQLEKFDPKGGYSAAWIAEGARVPSASALSYFDAVPRAWGLRADMPYPAPIVPADVGRARALEAYSARSF